MSDLTVRLLTMLGIRKPCKHLRVIETMFCDAICRGCGRNLDFIQTWRDTVGRRPDSSEISNNPKNSVSWNAARGEP
jgi:hypothetical protein